jgi:hypothetical protein
MSLPQYIFATALQIWLVTVLHTSFAVCDIRCQWMITQVVIKPLLSMVEFVKFDSRKELRVIDFPAVF